MSESFSKMIGSEEVFRLIDGEILKLEDRLHEVLETKHLDKDFIFNLNDAYGEYTEAKRLRELFTKFVRQEVNNVEKLS